MKKENNKIVLSVLNELKKQYNEAYEIYFYKHLESESKSRQRSYYKGKMNAFLDSIQSIENTKEKYFTD